MIFRIDVRTTAGVDPVGLSIAHQIQELGLSGGPVRSSRIFLIDSQASQQQIEPLAASLLADPVVETASLYSEGLSDQGSRIEVHLKPGVMDPVAGSTEAALRDLGVTVKEIRTGRGFMFGVKLPEADLRTIASRLLANGVIESVHFEPYLPKQFEAGHPYKFRLKHIALRELTDAELTRLSRDGHLFLSLAEMKAAQAYFREQGREPTDIELETLAQTWSEHCVHKTLKSAVDVEVRDSSGKVIGHRQYKNLIKETIFKSTMDLMAREAPDVHPGLGPFCLSVFSDNAGVIAFDETDAVCFKAETHNHPSAIEPYGGSATGAGGVIRDILGTGLGAKPIANTDVFCVAYPERGHTPLPKGVIHPKRVLQQIVAGVRDYGNRMGIPTVNGAVYFDDRYIGNPLVFCGCIGLIPRDKIAKQAKPGDAIVVVGGRTGRDGIHGATFSSAELTDTHADEFSHAVQIGNAITEKKVADVILQARDLILFTAITDCGAGGLSSAVGEMGEKTGASVQLDKVPLKYAGLRYDEIWISEAQERMVLSVPQALVAPLLKLAAGEDVEATVIGTFGTPERALILSYGENEVARMSMHFMHDGIPMPTRKAVVFASAKAVAEAAKVTDFKQQLLSALAHPNIASKHWVIRQYDHEVQGGSVVKPLVGPLQIGPSDASVVRPKLNSYRGIAIGCGLVPSIIDPYDMAIAAIDEAIRNVICVGADYNRIAILDNFCWPSVDDEITMGTLVRACEACHDAALAFGIPFISGKDSLHNQFTNQETGEVIRIPSTLLISAIGIVEDVRKCVTMDFKPAGVPFYLVAAKDPSNLASLSALHRKMSGLIQSGQILACHDVSDGGYAVAAVEMAIAGSVGLTLDPDLFESLPPFAESPGRYVVQTTPGGLAVLQSQMKDIAEVVQLGAVQLGRPELLLFNGRIGDTKEKVQTMIPVKELTTAWRGTLDW
jgi:phosphoribosylformylglycinamidine synthase subunit PurSL